MANNRRSPQRDIWAVIPVKETFLAKQRLAGVLSQRVRQDLAAAMFQDVMQALVVVPVLTGIAIVTLDPNATEIALRWGAEVWTDGARAGHTGAVTAAARRLAANGSAMLTVPGDVPRVSPADIHHLLTMHPEPPAFTIVPAWDQRGSNAILCSPADLVPLRFGPDSFFPHLTAARDRGVKPTIVRNNAIALDIDEPAELAKFMEEHSNTRTWALLDRCRAEWDETPAAAVEAQ